jgi:hypothetical protein
MRSEIEARIWIGLARESTKRAFLKLERNEAGREWHERTTAQGSVVQERSLSVSPHRIGPVGAVCLGDFRGTQESRPVKAPDSTPSQLDLGSVSHFVE